MIVKKTKKQIVTIAKNIKLLILDVDGVLTDGSIILDNEGNEFKAFHVRDGHGIKMLKGQRPYAPKFTISLPL
jgi:3-deoxy-D-manno-octulosonate 8-phosphate phosphatase (KDO 8-P phosphatase)